MWSRVEWPIIEAREPLTPWKKTCPDLDNYNTAGLSINPSLLMELVPTHQHQSEVTTKYNKIYMYLTF